MISYKAVFGPIGFMLSIKKIKKSAMVDCQKQTFDLTYDVINDLQTKFRNIFGKFLPGTIKCRSQIENRSSSFTFL